MRARLSRAIVDLRAYIGAISPIRMRDNVRNNIR